MSDKHDKTEKATPKRREDAKKKGQIARGAELPAAFALTAAVLAASAFGSSIFFNFGLFFHSLSHKIASPVPFTSIEIQLLFIESLKYLALIATPIVAVSLVAGLAGNFAQGGLVLSTEKFKPKADNFNPAKNIKKIFGLDSVVNLTKSSFKLVVLTYVAYGVLEPMVEKAPSMLNASVPTIVVELGSTLFSLSFRAAMVMLLFACADYGYSIYKHEKSLKMSKQDIRDEFKQQEGDPHMKNQRRRAARALAQKRSLADVPSASVVITNPTHISIALRYDHEKDAAPIVVAKGADIIAGKIRQIAREHEIPIIENKLLARALYKMVEPNQIVPVEFFGAVAEILAFVFRQKETRPE
jgi:flagellar biosynthesis protein FlhB